MLETAQAEGMSYQEFARLLEGRLKTQFGKGYLETVFRNQMNAADAVGTYDQMMDADVLGETRHARRVPHVRRTNA